MRLQSKRRRLPDHMIVIIGVIALGLIAFSVWAAIIGMIQLL